MEKNGYDPKAIYEKLDRYIKEIRFGSVVVVIQDGKTVQIEQNEKQRFAYKTADRDGGKDFYRGRDGRRPGIPPFVWIVARQNDGSENPVFIPPGGSARKSLRRED